MKILTRPLSHFFELSRVQTRDSAFFVAQRQRGARRFVGASEVRYSFAGWSANARNSLVGDAPQLFHPLYIAAILSAHIEENFALLDFPIPHIEFSTTENVRRSMTLNSMKMSTEYFQNGSLRVLDLVRNRLEEGQNDVVHDVCVYLMRQLLDVRAQEREARNLRAEAVAAFLGLAPNRVEPLFWETRLSSLKIAATIESGEVGALRRALDVESLVENQVALLRLQLRESSQKEREVLWLLDEIVATLRAHNEPGA